MLENPEVVGMGAIVVAIITGWYKMKPAMKQIESTDDTSLRTDLLARVNKLEADAETARNQAKEDAEAERLRHKTELVAQEVKYEAIIERMQLRYDMMVAGYEEKLKAFQERVDTLVETLMSTPSAPYTKENK